jgi:hypothetical protein
MFSSGVNEMPTIVRMCLAVLVSVVAVSAPALAQATGSTRTFVSGRGLDQNPCTITAPCRTFAAAAALTAAGGEITVLDTAGYGQVVITQPMTISARGVEAGVIVPASGVGITINAPSGSVSIRGLVIDGLGKTATTGISVVAAGSVTVHDSIIRGLTTGIQATPSAASLLMVSNSLISDCATIGAQGNAGVLLGMANVMFVNNGGNQVQGFSTSGASVANNVTVFPGASNPLLMQKP